MIKVIDFLKILSDETRLKVLVMLLKREMCVCEIMEELGLSQSLVSHHLRLLRKSGLVKDEKDGKWVFYSANETRLKEMLLLMNGLFVGSIGKKGKGPEYGRNYAFCEDFHAKSSFSQTE